MVIKEITERVLGRYSFKTVSGSVYFLMVGKKDIYLYRTNAKTHLRKDKKPISVLSIINLVVGESAIFELEPLNARADHTNRVTTRVEEITRLESVQKFKKCITPSSKRIYNEEYRVENDVDTNSESRGYYRGDCVRFRFNGTIHVGKIKVIDINGGGIFWGVMTSYDITGIFNHKKMTYAHVPKNDIIELIKPRKNFYL